MFWNKEAPKYSDSEEYAKRQQVIDAMLVLAKLLEFQADTDKEFRDKVKSKTSSLIDKI